MSLRQIFPGGIVKPGFNPLAAQTSVTTYESFLYTWGGGGDGKLGLGNTTSYSSPKQVGSLTNWASIAGDSASSCFGIKTDGTMWSWGNNNQGQLGLSNRTYYSSPKQIGALTTWYKVSGGEQNFLAIKTDGTLWAWGNNFDGKLGLNNRTYYSSPTQVGSLTTWSQIHAGSDFSAGIDTSGRLWTWGRNPSGGLGLNNRTYYSSPKQVGSLTNWKTLLIGHMHTNLCIAIKTDGTLWTWGKNSNIGAGGLGNVTLYSSPKQVGSLTNWLYIAGGRYNCSAIKTDGTMWRWGLNSQGQLGLGNQTNLSSPVQLGAFTDWTEAASGYDNWFGIRSSTLWACGSNNSGKLGLNNRTYYSSPKQIGSLSTWLKVTTTQGSTAALLF